jgi:glutamine amidotransferase-like uncharacterized protein
MANFMKSCKLRKLCWNCGLITLLVVLISGLASSFSFHEQLPKNPSDLKDVKAALYHERSSPSATDDTCSNALALMLQWMNATVDILEAPDIINGHLAEYDLFAVPGGYMPAYQEDLRSSGTKAIREFVANGGAYLGICGGAYFACDKVHWTENGKTSELDYSLDFFTGLGVGPIFEIADWPNYDLTVIKPNQTSKKPSLANESDYSVMYYGGPYFELHGTSEVNTIASYAVINKPAMITLEYDLGRVFLSGPHPEFEENSSRDGCTWDNHLDDKDSEWDLMLKVVLWLVDTAGSNMGHSQSITTTSKFSLSRTNSTPGFCIISLIIILPILHRLLGMLRS